MTRQTTIQYLVEHGYINDEVKNLCIEALEKQIPKKPYYEGNGYSDGELVYDTWRCPNCDSAYEVEYDDYKYCPNCGQAIDWRDEE